MNEKILIIEDDNDMVESMKVVLESKDYQVRSAGNGDEGLKIAKEIKPDLMILDVMMESPTEGFHVAYEVRKDQELKYTPILMVTAVNEETGQNFSPDTDGSFLPVDDFVEKPIPPDVLLKRVKKLLNMKKEEININGR